MTAFTQGQSVRAVSPMNHDNARGWTAVVQWAIRAALVTMQHSTNAHDMPSREAAKAIRRNRILDAARDLVRETGRTGFSMRVLAERADVSLVTPYNLFGSKQAVMYGLLDQDILRFAKQLASRNEPPIERLFRAVSLGRAYFGRDQRYYKTVLSAVYEGGADEYRSTFGRPRMALWRELVDQAAAAGCLRREVDPGALAASLSATYFATILGWVAGELTLPGMERRAHYAFALLLHSVAATSHRKVLWERVLTCQAAIRG
jgi:AcrR family transcriptional regulator